MKSITAQILFDDVASAMGWDSSDLGIRQWRDLRDALSAALAEVWGEPNLWWPDIMRTEYLALADEFSALRIARVGAYVVGDVVYFADADAYYMAISEVNAEAPAAWDGAEWIEAAGKWKELASAYEDHTIWEPGVHYQAGTFTTNSVFKHAGRFWLPTQAWLDAADNSGLSPTSEPDLWIELPLWRHTVPEVGYDRAPIGEIRSVSRSDPRVYGEPGEYFWTYVGDDKWIIRDGDATRYWIQYRLVTPTLSGDEFDAGTDYDPAPLDEQIYRSVMPEAVVPGPVATPTFSPAAGTYVGTQSVAISCVTSGATIYFTTDGSTPTEFSTEYTTPISVTSTQTIKAIGVKAGQDDSAVATAHFIIVSSDQVYWGASASTTLDGAGILALTGNRTSLDPAGDYAFTPPAEQYLYLAWPDDLPDQPVATTGFMVGPFPAVLAGAAQGYDQSELGWEYKLVTVSGAAYRLYRTYWPIELAVTITVST